MISNLFSIYQICYKCNCLIALEKRSLIQNLHFKLEKNKKSKNVERLMLKLTLFQEIIGNIYINNENIEDILK